MSYQGASARQKPSRRFLSRLDCILQSDSFIFVLCCFSPSEASRLRRRAEKREHSIPQETARDAMAAATLAEMEKAASCMIQVIKDTPDLRTTKLAISGDMAIRKYLPEYGHQHAGVSRP
jgi:hypothetical protein